MNEEDILSSGSHFQRKNAEKVSVVLKSGDEAPAVHVTRYKLRKRIALFGKSEESLNCRDLYRLIRWRVSSIENASNGRSGGGAICAGVRRVTCKGDAAHRLLPRNEYLKTERPED